jgi:hypothetical protein
MIFFQMKSFLAFCSAMWTWVFLALTIITFLVLFFYFGYSLLFFTRDTTVAPHIQMARNSN